MQHAGPLPPPPTTMPPNAAPHHERFFPTANNPPASVMLPAVLTYLIVVPVVSVLFAAMAGGQGPHRGNVGIFVGFAAFALITPGVVFGLVGTALGRVATGCSVTMYAVGVHAKARDLEVPLENLDRVELLDRAAFLRDPSVGGISGFRILEGNLHHPTLGRVYMNIARDIVAAVDEPALVRLMLLDGSSVIVDPIDSLGFIECLDSARSTGSLPPEPARFPCTRLLLFPEWTPGRGASFAVTGFFLLGGWLAATILMLSTEWILALAIGLMATVLAAGMYLESRRRPYADDLAREALVGAARFTLLCRSSARHVALHDVAGVERLPYYDFWAEVGMETEPGDEPTLSRTVRLAGPFHHPKHGRGYVNWRRLLPIDERAQPLVALRLKDKSLVVVDVDDPDALEAELRQRLASLPAPVDLPVGRPE